MIEKPPESITVILNPTFWDAYLGSLSLLRYQGKALIIHAIFPLAGLFALVFPPCVGLPFTITNVLVALLGFLFTPIVLAVAVRAARRRNKLAQGPFTYLFNSEGVHTSTSSFSQTIKWSGIPRVRQSKRFLFVFISPSLAFCLPLAVLENQHVLEDLRNLAKQHTDFR